MQMVAIFSLLWMCLLAQFAKAAQVTTSDAGPRDAAKHGQILEKTPAVDFARGLLSVKIDNAPLSAVLKLVADRTGARVVLLGASDQAVGADFIDQPLEEGLRRLLRGRNLAFFYTPQMNTKQPSHRLSEIRIFPLTGEPLGKSTVFDGAHEASLPLRARAKTPADDKKFNAEIARLAKRLNEAKDIQARLQAATALAKISDSNVIRPLSEALLTDTDASVRATAAEALAKTWDEAAVAPLTRTLLEDASANVREAAAKALGVTWSENAVSPLIAALLRDRDALVREQAAWGLAQTAGEEAVEALGHALTSDPRVFVREAAAYALGSIGGLDALDALAKASATDVDDWVRETATISAINSPK